MKFHHLLTPTDTPPLPGAPPPKRKHRVASRRVSDFASWLEAWNTYLRVRVTHAPAEALALIKYQSHMAMLFASYPPAACIQYDRLFRQAAAQDPLVRWDCFQPDVFVWSMTPRATAPPTAPVPTPPPAKPWAPFRYDLQQALETTANRAPPSARLGPPPRNRPESTRPNPHSSHTSSGQEICKRFNWGRCTLADCIFSHTCWTPGCNGAHPASGCPKRPQ